ncbi:hypothetical protein [Candidatus Borreliella tachyglossi]|uniref:hypothetical protein n=1 Tax=Candidatus Borreliella tachyglossi TaxID=1964448 RepID=UPI004041A9A6
MLDGEVLKEKAMRVAGNLKNSLEHEAWVAGAGVFETVKNNKLTRGALGGIDKFRRKVFLSPLKEDKVIGNEYIPYKEHLHFYDAVSISISISDRNRMIPIYPLDFTLNLDFENEEQYNLRGQLVGVLRSFKGGTLNLQLPENIYFFDSLYSAYTGTITIYISSREQKEKASCVDRLICVLDNIDFSSDFPELNSSLDLRILSIERIRDLSQNFESLFPVNVPYFVPIMKDNCFLNLVYSKSGVDQVITLHNITGLHKNHKNRSDIKNIPPVSQKGVGTWNYLYYGLEPATLNLTANIYDIIDIDYLKNLLDSKRTSKQVNSMINASRGTPEAEEKESVITSKEEQVQVLYKLFESCKKTKDGVVPYEISIQSLLLADLKPTNFGYYLQEIDIKNNSKNYIEVELRFIEIREYGKDLPSYVPKDKDLIVKRDTSYKLNLLSAGELSDKERSKIIQAIGRKDAI